MEQDKPMRPVREPKRRSMRKSGTALVSYIDPKSYSGILQTKKESEITHTLNILPVNLPTYKDPKKKLHKSKSIEYNIEGEDLND